jgi:hypothetical protein
MLVVTVAKTHAVLAAASRGASGAPPVAELVGEALIARMADSEQLLRVPAETLEVKEVDRSDDVFRDPHAYVVDTSGTLVVSANVVDKIQKSSAVDVTITLKPAPLAPDKDVVLLIDAGASSDPLRFVAKTVLNQAAVKITVSGVPAGAHLALASADGYNALLEELTFP